ncbi:MAG: hypothetical protein IJ897_07295 [Prevotella sp.]|nr:hypothetical protein [Prevotella sp.]
MVWLKISCDFRGPIVHDPIKQAYLTHETGINASLTIGSFFRVVVSASSKEIKEPSLDHYLIILVLFQELPAMVQKIRT